MKKLGMPERNFDAFLLLFCGVFKVFSATYDSFSPMRKLEMQTVCSRTCYVSRRSLLPPFCISVLGCQILCLFAERHLLYLQHLWIQLARFAPFKRMMQDGESKLISLQVPIYVSASDSNPCLQHRQCLKPCKLCLRESRLLNNVVLKCCHLPEVLFWSK